MKVFPLNRSGCEVGEPFGETKSKRTIEIDEFVPKKEIDELYMRDPYYIVPDGEVGQQAFAVIREAIRYHLDGGPIAHPDCPMGEVLRSGVSIHNREIVVERSDGSRGVVLVNIVAIKDGSGNVLGAVNCFGPFAVHSIALDGSRVV